MSELFNLEAQTRTDLGKGASRRLRHANQVPAIIYGAGADPVSITLAHNKVFRAQEEETFYSSILTLNVDGKEQKAIIKDMQRHPFKQLIMHIDFLRVAEDKPFVTQVPLHFLNEEAVMKNGASVARFANKVSISCLPKDLPNFVEVDLAGLEIGSAIHLSDLKLAEGVSSTELAKGASHDLAIAAAK